MKTSFPEDLSKWKISAPLYVNHNNLFKKPELLTLSKLERDQSQFKFFPKFGYGTGLLIDRKLRYNILLGTGLIFEKRNELQKTSVELAALMAPIGIIEIQSNYSSIQVPVLLGYRYKNISMSLGLINSVYEYEAKTEIDYQSGVLRSGRKSIWFHHYLVSDISMHYYLNTDRIGLFVGYTSAFESLPFLRFGIALTIFKF